MTCNHHWTDDGLHWNNPPVQDARRCSKCKEVRLQPVASAPYITLRISITEDLTEPLQAPLPNPYKQGAAKPK